MKTTRLALISLAVSVFLLAINIGGQLNSWARSGDRVAHFLETPVKAAPPPFLEVGKVYQFRVAFSIGDGSNVTATGKIEKIDAGSGWVYLNHYVTTYRKGKPPESKYEGHSWINLSQVYECGEVTPAP